MSEATLTETMGLNPESAKGLQSRVEAESNQQGKTGAAVCEKTEPTMPRHLLAARLTQAEWDEQDKLLAEYVSCITQDRQRAAEILPKIIWPANLLKVKKKSLGASHIRKEGYNTLDADLAYGPDWLDVDDGGPTSSCAEGYKLPTEEEMLRSFREL